MGKISYHSLPFYLFGIAATSKLYMQSLKHFHDKFINLEKKICSEFILMLSVTICYLLLYFNTCLPCVYAESNSEGHGKMM